MLIIMATAGSLEKTITSGITAAVNNNPTTTRTTFSTGSRRIVPSEIASQTLFFCERSAADHYHRNWLT
jgi:hypothetical protein